jgi:DnaJ domain
MTYYDLLEVSPHASAAVIKAAYKSLMQRYHPDKNADDKASAQRAAEIAQAYDTLSDAARRTAYDASLASAITSHLKAASMQPPHAAPRAHRARVHSSHAQYYYVVWAFIAVVILTMLWLLLHPRAALESTTPPMSTAVRDTPSEQAAAPAGSALSLPALHIVLSDTQGLVAGSQKVLNIAQLQLTAGNANAKKLIWYLDDHKAQVRFSIENKLAAAHVAELQGNDANRYIEGLVLNAITAALPANRSDLAEYANTLDIALPQAYAFSVEAIPVKPPAP